MEYIITCDEQSQNLCKLELSKIKTLTIKKWISGGVALINFEGSTKFNEVVYNTPLIFVRHCFKVQKSLNLSENYLEAIKENALEFLDKEKTFSMQLRKSKGSPIINTEILQISEFLVEQGYILDVKNCEQTISIYATETEIFIGTDLVCNNLSKYKGGSYHFADDENTISRAEYKLMEAIDVFNINFDGLIGTRHAIDLGAAPGGWTKVLANMGLSVFAVDPARLDERVLSIPQVKHYKITSQEFLHRNFNIKFDILVNDMKMDMFESAKITNSMAKILHDDAHVVITLKLPENCKLPVILRCIDELAKTYKIVSARHLFHNRSEITVYAQKK